MESRLLRSGCGLVAAARDSVSGRWFASRPSGWLQDFTGTVFAAVSCGKSVYSMGVVEPTPFCDRSLDRPPAHADARHDAGDELNRVFCLGGGGSVPRCLPRCRRGLRPPIFSIAKTKNRGT